nr:hypothetical protein [uncultured Microbacterium sp.]
MDLAAKSYQNASRLKSLLKRYVDKMAAFTRGERAGVVVTEEMVTDRALHLAVSRSATADQQAVLDDIVVYGNEVGVSVIVEVMR